MSERNAVTGCWDDSAQECEMCTGEGCNLCGPDAKNCEHDVIERHQESDDEFNVGAYIDND